VRRGRITTVAYLGDRFGLSQVKRDPQWLWPREVQDFVPWLITHKGMLGDCLGIRLDVTGREVQLGEMLRRHSGARWRRAEGDH
jgi:hypothetical protein